MADKSKATWHTPVAVLKNKQEVWEKLENISKSRRKAEKMDLTPEITYFNSDKKYDDSRLEYDQYFAYTKTFPLWNPRKPKDNRRYLPKIRERIFEEEKDKIVPVITSFNYGRPALVPYDVVESAFKRADATKDFYRTKGVLQKETSEIKHFKI